MNVYHLTKKENVTAYETWCGSSIRKDDPNCKLSVKFADENKLEPLPCCAGCAIAAIEALSKRIDDLEAKREYDAEVRRNNE